MPTAPLDLIAYGETAVDTILKAPCIGPNEQSQERFVPYALPARNMKPLLPSSRNATLGTIRVGIQSAHLTRLSRGLLKQQAAIDLLSYLIPLAPTPKALSLKQLMNASRSFVKLPAAKLHLGEAQIPTTICITRRAKPNARSGPVHDVVLSVNRKLPIPRLSRIVVLGIRNLTRLPAGPVAQGQQVPKARALALAKNIPPVDINRPALLSWANPTPPTTFAEETLTTLPSLYRPLMVCAEMVGRSTLRPANIRSRPADASLAMIIEFLLLGRQTLPMTLRL